MRKDLRHGGTTWTQQRRQASKGERRLVVTRLPTEIADRVALAADERGMTVSDYLATLVYSDLGLPGAAVHAARRPSPAPPQRVTAPGNRR